MVFVRKVVNGSVLDSVLPLPQSFRGIQVEVTVVPAEKGEASRGTPFLPPSSSATAKTVRHSAFGRLNVYANPRLIPEEKGAWEEAAAEKHVLR